MRYRIPFGKAEADPESEGPFEPGRVLAIAAETAGSARDRSDGGGTQEAKVDTPWGSLPVEYRSKGVIVAQTPEASVPVPRTLLTAVAMQLGIERTLVEQTGAQVQVVDVGRQVLVVPYPSADAVREAPEQADPSAAPQIETEEGVVYAVTQRTPYVKLLARTWGPADPLACLAACALHLVLSGTFRPTYPRTRIVGQILNHGEERCEITVQAKKVGDTAKVERVLVGGRVEPDG